MKINITDSNETKYIMVKQDGKTIWVPEFEYDAVMDGRA